MFQQGGEAVEEHFRIQRAAVGLGMELDGEPGHAFVLHTFVGAIVHVDQEGLPAFRQGVVGYGVTVVLAGDEALGGAVQAHRLVVAAVAVFQFIDTGSCGNAQQLVAQADAHDGLDGTPFGSGFEPIGHYFPQDGHCLLALLRIARTVAQEQAVVFHSAVVVVPRDADHFQATGEQAADDIVFAAAVHQHLLFLGGLGREVAEHLAAGDIGHEIMVFVSIYPGVVLLAFHYDAAAHHALFAKGLGEGAGVDAGNGGDVFAPKPGFQVFLRVPVAVGAAVIGHYQGAGIDVTAFKVLFQAVFFLTVRRYAIIADEGKGGNQDLARIGRVGQAFGITRHGRVEHHFPRSIPEASECGPFVAGSVFQYQNCFHTQKKPVPPSGRTGMI